MDGLNILVGWDESMIGFEQRGRICLKIKKIEFENSF